MYRSFYDTLPASADRTRSPYFQTRAHDRRAAAFAFIAATWTGRGGNGRDAGTDSIEGNAMDTRKD